MKRGAILLMTVAFGLTPLLALLSGCTTSSASTASGVHASGMGSPRSSESHPLLVENSLFGVAVAPVIWVTFPLWIVDAAVMKSKRDAEQEKKAAGKPERPVNPLPQTS